MLILGLESSCDETAAAVVKDGHTVRSSLISSQVAVHQPFGGVVPEVASREHLRVIDPLVREALHKAQVGVQDLDGIAVTQGPGLIGALLVGVAYAKGLAAALGKPLIPVDHVHAHLHGALLDAPLHRIGIGIADFFPAFGLVVSGGHTNLYVMASPTDFALIACSIDDACGESFDKVAKILGLGYPGGPAIEACARQGTAAKVALPRMVEQKSRLEFSYSGLKTFMSNLAQAEPKPMEPARIADICAAFQDEALGQIIRKVQAACLKNPGIRRLVVAGGVAANQRFRQLTQRDLPQLEVHFPAMDYCSDNAAMIAAYAYYVHAAAAKQPFGTKRFFSYDWDAYSRYDYPSTNSP